MTHQDNVAAVRAACIAANPEITELKFGCIVSVRGFQRNAVVVGSDHSDNFCLGYTDNGQRCETWMSGSRLKDEEKILGRDATLPDVLLALEEKNRGHYAIDARGELLAWGNYYATGGRWQEIGITLDLRTNLSGWSEEAVAALAALLKRDE